jgi:hypothetical protein
MGLGDFLKDVGDATAHGLRSAVNTVNALDPFHDIHYNPSSSAAPTVTNRPLQGPVGAPVAASLENVSRGLNWVYSNGVSQPLSTALMVGGLPGGPTSAHAWGQAWHAAEHISPGQALFLGNDPNEKYSTQKAVESPLEYFKPESGQLPPGFDQLPKDQQQQILKDAGMPVVGNAYINELRQSSDMFKWSSGTADFAARWWADPVIVGGKIAGGARREFSVMKRPAAGWSADDIDKIMNKSVMVKAGDWMFANRSNPALINNLSMAQQSGMGPRLGSVVSLLRNRSEIDDFLRVSLGDVNALERLQTKNVLAAARYQQDSDRFSALDQMRTRYPNNPRMQQMIDQHMDALTTNMNADYRLVRSYNAVLNHPAELDQINLTRWSTKRAQDRFEGQQAYRADSARGGASARNVRITPTPMISRGTSTPIDFGVQKSVLHGIGDFFSTPVTVARSFGNARPNGYMRIDDIDKSSIAELRGQLARIPGITDTTRLKFLNDYLKTTTEQQRVDLLDSVGRIGASKIAEKHGMDFDMGHQLYQAHLGRQMGEKDAMKRYSAATRPIELPDGTFARIHVDEFASDGGKLVIHPNLSTKLGTDHVFQDLSEMDKVLARHSGALSALKLAAGGTADWMNTGAEFITQLFKFGTLFRLGYIPRVASDDLAGQWARLGSIQMAMRAGWGARNGATNAALWLERPMVAARQETARAGTVYAKEKMAEVQKEIDAVTKQVATRRGVYRADLRVSGRRLANAQARRAAMTPATHTATQMSAMDKLVAKHELAVQRASRSMGTGVGARNMKIRDLQAHHGFLDHYRGIQQKVVDDAEKTLTAPRRMQGTREIKLGNGVTAPGAFTGPEGEFYQKLVSGDESVGQIFATNKTLVHGHLMRSFDHGGKSITAAQDETLHATSWAHAINHQIMQDPLAQLAVQGHSVDEMERWLTTTVAGRAYRERLGLVMTQPREFAESAWHEVAQYLPTPEIRMKALESSGVTPTFLKDAVPMSSRPEVHTGQVGQTQIRYKRALDDVQRAWFHFAAEIPANRLSRHPLFNQLYEGHLISVKNTLRKQGAYDTTVDGVNKMATTARRLALRDTRRLVFDIAHRSDASAAMRFVSPFMTATNESFQRWGRILADKPEIAGYAYNFFNAPIAAGQMQDADGNDILKDGYSYTMTYPVDPKTGDTDYSAKPTAVKRLVPKSERYIVGRMPHWLVDSPVGVMLGAERSSGKFRLSQNSMNLVTQGDPWFSPGVGPIVQMPVNEIVKDKPSAAELARHLDILPFGPQQGTGLVGDNVLGRATGFVLPATFKNALTAIDTSDERYQSVKLQIIQRAAYEHANLGKPMPSAKQLSDMTRNYWLFSSATSFTQPFATQKQDAYQFYRDQYNALMRANPKTADTEFLNRYQESYFIFAQSQSHNATGIQATNKAVALSKQYSAELAANPELGALIVGPEGNGPFSPEAYSYQLNTPVSPGGAEMQRTKMTADQALAENKRRLGWAKYAAMVNRLTAELHNKGFKSFNDDGAQGIKQEKSNFTKLYSQPLYPDGSTNPFYNKEWSEDYSTLDPLRYDRLIPAMTTLASSPLAAQKNRGDLRVLGQYLGGRKALLGMLNDRAKAGGAKTLNANANADLADRWQRFVDNLIESNTAFGDLHSRYLSRDLNYEEAQA